MKEDTDNISKISFLESIFSILSYFLINSKQIENSFPFSIIGLNESEYSKMKAKRTKIILKEKKSLPKAKKEFPLIITRKFSQKLENEESLIKKIMKNLSKVFFIFFLLSKFYLLDF